MVEQNERKRLKGIGVRQWVRIKEAGQLIKAAQKHGIELSTKEADTMLGYLEGHDYCLMADDSGMTARHDEQYGDSHQEDEPYSVQEAVEFCQEMNQDLLRDSEQGEEYSAHLRKDEQLLDALMERVAASCQPGEV